jgi:hypothetical protein
VQGEGVGTGLHSSVRKTCAVLALAATTTVLLGACGDDDDSGQSGSNTADGSPASVDAGPPPTVEEALAEQFPVPEPTESAPPGSAAAIKAGRDACKGKTPSQISDEFIAEARSGLTEAQLEMVEDIERYEKQVTPNFVAGQLAAGVYEATLSENEERGGYQGCVYELAQKLRMELSKKQGKQP